MHGGGKYQGSHHVEPPATARVENKKDNFSNPPLPQKAARANAMEQPVLRNEYRGIGDISSAGLMNDVPIVGKPAQIHAIQSPSSDIKNATPRLARSFAGKEPESKQTSIGLVELTLKLLSIVLSCIVLLFLHKANKMATARYDDDILELKHIVKPRSPK